MDQIGDKQLVLSKTCLLRPDDMAVFETDGAGPTIRVSLRFTVDPNQQNQPNASWSFSRLANEVASLEITLRNWSKSSPAALASPVRAGVLADGRAVGFQIAHTMLGPVHLMHLDLYIGGVY